MLMTHSAGAEPRGRRPASRRSGAGADDAQSDPAAAQDATALALGLAAPHAVVDPLGRARTRGRRRRRGTRRRCAGPPARRRRHSGRRWTATGPCTSPLPSSPCPWILRDPRGAPAPLGPVRPPGTPASVVLPVSRPGPRNGAESGGSAAFLTGFLSVTWGFLCWSAGPVPDAARSGGHARGPPGSRSARCRRVRRVGGRIGGLPSQEEPLP